MHKVYLTHNYIYVITGTDNFDEWGYGILCAGSLSTCIKFIDNSPFYVSDDLTDRIVVAKNVLWGIVGDVDELSFHAGFLKRVYMSDLEEWNEVKEWLKNG